MSRLLKILKSLRNNWKKSVIGSAALYYGGKYAFESYDQRQLMRVYCEVAKQHGDKPISVDARPRHITVILNPAANRRKAKKDFEDYCAPLLYLAGLSVNIIVTEGEGQARSLAEKLEEDTDAIIVGGGDGTLSEVVTGIMRRSDGPAVARKVPIGILPLGRTNTVAQQLFKDHCNERVKFLAEAALAVIQEVTCPLDMIKFQVLPTENYDPGKPVFSLAGMEWGAFRDAQAKREKYWYFGGLRGYASYFFTGLKDDKSGVAWQCKAAVQVFPPCRGCSKCFSERLDLHPEKVPRQSWWSVFGKRQAAANIGKPVVDYSKIVNEECGKYEELQISTVDFSLVPGSINAQDWSSREAHLQLSFGLPELSLNDFIREGWARESGNIPTRAHSVKARKVRLWPESTLPQTPEDPTSASKGPERWISIDNEDYEEKALEATILPNMIMMYRPSGLSNGIK